MRFGARRSLAFLSLSAVASPRPEFYRRWSAGFVHSHCAQGAPNACSDRSPDTDPPGRVAVTSSKRAIPFAPNRAPCSWSSFECSCDWLRAAAGSRETQRSVIEPNGQALYDDMRGARLRIRRAGDQATDSACCCGRESVAVGSDPVIVAASPRPTSRCFRTRTENWRPLAPSWSDGRAWRPFLYALHGTGGSR
jgi:hypothetical protein